MAVGETIQKLTLGISAIEQSQQQLAEVANRLSLMRQHFGAVLVGVGQPVVLSILEQAIMQLQAVAPTLNRPGRKRPRRGCAS
jgi:hypothetical protein